MNVKGLNYIFSLTVLASLLFYSCGSKIQSSNGSTSNGTAQDVGFDPTISSNFEVISYNVIYNRLINDFKLNTNDPAVTLLNSNQALFSVPNPRYDAAYGAIFTKIMSLACQNMDTDTFFANGPKIDTIWNRLTGKTPDDGARAIESDLLEQTKSQPADVQEFSLCIAASLDARAIFINYIRGA